MTTSADIVRAITDHIQQNFLFNARTVGPQEPLIASGTIDSTGIMELLGFIEQRFGVTFQDAELVGENFETIQRISDLVASKIPK